LWGGFEEIPWAIATAAGALACLLGALHARRSTFRCHEYGVYKAGLFGERTLRYTDVAAFSYSAVRHFHNGAYTGTIFRLGFEPEPGRAAQRIIHSATLPHADQALENLRDHISRVIGGRMARQLAAKEPVRWTPRLRFLPDGIEHQPAGVFGRKEPVVVPFANIYSYQIQQGTFCLWARGQQKPVVREAMTQPNFFPGFFLLNHIVPLGPPAGEVARTES
jgi:hypothetical protein